MSATAPQFKALTVYSRSSWDAANPGRPAPAFDPTKPIRGWVDPGQSSELFLSSDPTAPEYLSQSFGMGELDLPNVTGAETYPPYVTAPTTATWQAIVADPSNLALAPMPLPAAYLSLKADADKVASLIPGSLIVTGQSQYPSGIFNLDPTDPRQPWWIKFADGSGGFVGTLVAQMYANGIGAPGSFVSSISGGYGWVSTHVPDGFDGKPHPVMSLPMIPFDTSKFRLSNDPALTGQAPSIFGSFAMIVPINAAPEVPTGGSGLTTGQATQINHIESMLVTLLTAERLPTA